MDYPPVLGTIEDLWNDHSLFMVSIATIITIILVLREILKPVDKRWQFGAKKPWRLPQGPRGQPIVGNLYQMFQARDRGEFGKYLSSLSTNGEMTTLHMGSKTWVVLNSERVVSEIITKRSKITHERPHMPIAHDLVSQSRRSVMRRTKDWSESRRIMHQLLSGSNLKVYGRIQEMESNVLLKNYLESPKRWASHHYRYATAFLYRVVMGFPLEKGGTEMDAFQKVGMEFIWSLNRSVIDFFPQLSKLPSFLQPWRPYWKSMGEHHRAVMLAWWAPVRDAVKAGIAPPSFVRDVLFDPNMKFAGNDVESMYIAASVVAAGGDNSRMTINTFIMAMITHPEVQRRAQKELDRLCGDANRLPTLADLPNTPYVAAMIKEVLRWRSTVPIIPPHELTEDLEFENYHFPAGTNFLINSMALGAEFEDPDDFKPERWINGEEGNAVAQFFGFGGGRRICVGYKVAQQGLYLAYARILYCFNLRPDGPVDSRKLNHQSTEQPFPVRITVRSTKHEQLILDLNTSSGAE